MKRIFTIFVALVTGGLGIAIASLVPQAAEAGLRMN